MTPKQGVDLGRPRLADTLQSLTLVHSFASYIFVSPLLLEYVLICFDVTDVFCCSGHDTGALPSGAGPEDPLCDRGHQERHVGRAARGSAGEWHQLPAAIRSQLQNSSLSQVQ